MSYSKKEISKLDKYYPPCGECWFCGHRDKRHRMWDTFLSLSKGGDSAEFIAGIYNINIEYVELVLEIKPYHKNNYLLPH